MDEPLDQEDSALPELVGPTYCCPITECHYHKGSQANFFASLDILCAHLAIVHKASYTKVNLLIKHVSAYQDVPEGATVSRHLWPFDMKVVKHLPPTTFVCQGSSAFTLLVSA